ncbi:hypothetical protein B0H19DRAFT_173775 [Mycena capillaripes]|nr:hypothetical protein B0H19DRAFT_173775 [Mycena capillaripes]
MYANSRYECGTYAWGVRVFVLSFLPPLVSRRERDGGLLVPSRGCRLPRVHELDGGDVGGEVHSDELGLSWEPLCVDIFHGVGVDALAPRHARDEAAHMVRNVLAPIDGPDVDGPGPSGLLGRDRGQGVRDGAVGGSGGGVDMGDGRGGSPPTEATSLRRCLPLLHPNFHAKYSCYRPIRCNANAVAA